MKKILQFSLLIFGLICYLRSSTIAQNSSSNKSARINATGLAYSGLGCDWPFNSLATNPVDGKIYGFWRKSSGSSAVYNLIKWSGSAWSLVSSFTPANVFAQTGVIQDGSDYTSMDIDALGHYHVAFSGAQSYNGTCCSQERGVWYGRSDNGTTWTFTKIQTYTDPNGWQNTSFPKIKVDNSNNPHIIFNFDNVNSSVVVGGTTYQRYHAIRHHYYNGSTWVGEVAFQQGGASNEVLDTGIAIDGNGKVHISFVKETDGTGLDGGLWYTNNVSGSWSAASELAHGVSGHTFGSGNSIAIDAANKVHIVHNEFQSGQNAKLIETTNTSGSFVNTQINGNLTGSTTEQGFKMNANGDMLVPYKPAPNPNNTINYAYKLNGSNSWTTAVAYTGTSNDPFGTFYSGILSPSGTVILLFDHLLAGDCPTNARDLYFSSNTVSGSLQSTTTALASNSNPSAVGANVIFSATVSPSTATGTLTFKDGATTLATGTVNSGVATYSTTALTAGTHSITAIYGGNATFSTSTSMAVSQVVNACTVVSTPTGNLTWTGAVSTDWNNACNWSPASVPTATNAQAIINSTTNQPVINSGTNATVKQVYVNGNARLIINSGASLTVSGYPATTIGITVTNATLTNNGILNVNSTNSGTSSLVFDQTSTFVNSGTATLNSSFAEMQLFANSSTIITNNANGIINFQNATGFKQSSTNTNTFTNHGTVNYSGLGFSFNLKTGGTLNNDGVINSTSGQGISNATGGTINNLACGKILMTNTSYTNAGTTNNAGVVSTLGTLDNTGGSFTNSSGGVLHYGTLTGTITNSNGSVRVNDNATNSTIFSYQGSFTGTVNGIYTNSGATTSAGTFTAPNTFTPLNTLPAGSQTLYAKITPSGGACFYVIPFTYFNCNITLTAGAVTNPTTCGGTGSIAFTSTNLPNRTYTLNYTLNGSATSKSITVASNAFSLTALLAGSYNTFSITNAGCTGTTGTLNPAKIVANPASPTLTAGTVTNPTTCGGTGSIAFTSTNLPNGTYTLNYTLNGSATSKSITVASNAFSLTALLAGSYNTFSITNAGCTGTTGTLNPAKIVADPATPTLTAGAVTNPTTCGGMGSIAFTSTNLPNGTYTLNYTLNGSATSKSITVASNAFSLTALLAGSYNTFSITNAGCTGTTGTLNPAKIVANPASPTLTAGAITQPTTCGGTGSIAFTSTNLPNGTYTLNYTLNGSATSKSITVASNAFSLTALLAGSYNTFSITNAGCTGTTGTLNPAKIVADPAAPTLTAGAITQPTTCGGTGSITFTSTNLPNGTYSMSFTGTGTTTSPQNITVSGNAFSLTGLTAGTYSNFSVTNNGCTSSIGTSRVLTNPASPTLTAGAITQPTTCGGTGSIAFTSTNLPNGTYTLNYTLNGSATSKSITVASNAFSLTALLAGSYNTFSITNAGCTGTTGTLNPAKIVADPATPTLTAGAITQPTTCGGTGSIAFTSTNLPNGTYSLGFTGAGSPKNVTVLNNSFSLTGLLAGAYSNFSLVRAGCTGSDASSKTLSNPPSPTLLAGTAVNPSICGGVDGSIPFTTTNLPSGNYTLTFTGAGSPRTITVANNVFTLNGLSAGGYSNFSITNNGCIGTNAVSRALSDPTPPVLTLGTSTNPTACNLSDGTISFTVTNVTDGIYSLTYSGTGSPKNVMVTGGAFTLTGLPDGVFSNFSLTNSGGCTGSLATSVSLVDLALPTLTAGTAANPTTCSGTNGSIPFTTANLPDGVYSLSFTSTGTVSPQSITVAGNAFTLSGLSAGTYSNFSITRSGCTGTLTTTITLAAPASPTLTAGTTENPSTCSGTEGSIAFTTDNLPNDTYSLSFNSTGTSSPINVNVTNNTFTLSGLAKGDYRNFSITNNGCTGTDETLKTLSDPATITITAGTTTNPSTCSGAEGSIAFSSTNLPDGIYSLTYTATGTGATADPKTVTITENLFTITDLSAGTYNNFSIVYVGCTALDATSKTLTSPATPTLTAGTVTNPTTCLSSDGTIAFTTTLPNGTYAISYTGVGSPKTVTVASGAFALTGLPDGTFSNFSINANGCTSTDASVKVLTDPAAPILTAGMATNPTTCASTDGSIAFTTSLANGTYTMNYTGSGSPQTINVSNGAFILGNLPDGTFSGFSITTGGCTGTSSATKTLTDPAAPTLTAGTVTNPATCSGTDGSIAFTTSLANGTYSLSYTGTGSPQSITVVSGAFTLSSLSAGTYSGFSVTTGGCTGTSSATKTLTDPVGATLTAGTATNPTTCLSMDGMIAFTTTLANGTYSISYTGSGSPKTITVASGTFTLTGLPDGTFSNFSITNNGCTSTDATSKTLTDPASPTLTTGMVTNPTTCTSSDGSIAFTTSLANGTYTLNYTGSGSPQMITVASGAFTLGNLPDGTFSGFSVTTGGCTGTSSATKTLTDPANPTLVAGTATNPTTCSGTNGSIAFTTSLADGIYTLNYTGAGSPRSITISGGTFILSNLSSGAYSGFSVTAGGCTGTSSATKTLTDPTAPTLTAGTATNPTICGNTDGSIAFTTTLPNGTYSLTYTGAVSAKSITVVSGAFSLTGLSAGTFSDFSVTNTGCTGTDVTIKTLTDPTLTAPAASGTTINSGSTASLSATCSAGDVKWYDALTGGNLVSSVNPFITPTLTTNTDYYAACEVAGSATCFSTRTQVTVTVIANRVYVNIANTNPTQDGTSWATAYSNLQTALTTATTGFEIWVAQGTYKPTTTNTRTIYFTIPSSVKVYGGFIGTENALTERNFRTNTTILSGDIGTVNVASDNAYHVVIFDGSSNTTVLDGFTITGGNANFDSRRVGSSTANPTTTTIETGGGIVIQNASSPMITNCTIVNNAAVTGGGIYVGDASLPKIMACKIMANEATFGGGISFQDGSNGSLNNTLLSGNRGIGGVYNNTSNPIITNCTLGGNGGYNGGIFNSNSQPVVKNTIIWGNSTPFNDTQSIITYSTIQGGYPGTGNINYDPKFVSPVPDGLSPTLNGDYHVQAPSLAIDRGDNTGISLIDTDLDGNLRRYNGGMVDMGAYEFQGAATSNMVISAQTGDWESNSTWVGLKVPAVGDVVVIDANHIITINTNATAKSIEYRATGQIKFKTAAAKFNIGL